jgi:hypothetical protein
MLRQSTGDGAGSVDPAFSLTRRGACVNPAKIRIKRGQPAEESSGAQDSEGPSDRDLSRRLFLKRGSLGVAVGLVSTVPGLPGLLTQVSSDAPAVDDAAAESTGADAAALSEPLVVHVKDIQSGEMSLYFGEREVAYRDPQLASRILRAAR